MRSTSRVSISTFPDLTAAICSALIREADASTETCRLRARTDGNGCEWLSEIVICCTLSVKEATSCRDERGLPLVRLHYVDVRRRGPNVLPLRRVGGWARDEITSPPYRGLAVRFASEGRLCPPPLPRCTEPVRHPLPPPQLLWPESPWLFLPEPPPHRSRPSQPPPPLRPRPSSSPSPPSWERLLLATWVVKRSA